MSPEDTFTYEPLPDASSYIRLLRLKPSENISAVSCDISIHPLESAPPFCAISYTWGSPLETCIIPINGKKFQVRENARYALWQMSRHSNPLRISDYFWMDSICINQRDHVEKSKQVQNMSGVYSRADVVAACIGECDDACAALFAGPPKPESAGSMMIQEPGVMSFSHRPYFTRLWIVQELILAKRIHFFCGQYDMDWEKLAARNGNLRTQLAYRPTLVQPLLASEGPHLEKNLVEAVVRYEMAECQEERDRVYALLSIVEDSGRTSKAVRVDYEKPLFDVLGDFFQSLPTVFDALSLRLALKRLRDTFGVTLKDRAVSSFYQARRNKPQRVDWTSQLPPMVGIDSQQSPSVLFTVAGVVPVLHAATVRGDGINTVIQEWDSHFPEEDYNMTRPAMEYRPPSKSRAPLDLFPKHDKRATVVRGGTGDWVLRKGFVATKGAQAGDFIVSFNTRPSDIWQDAEEDAIYLVCRPHASIPGAFAIVGTALSHWSKGIDLAAIPEDIDEYVILARGARRPTCEYEYGVFDREDLLSLLLPETLDLRRLGLPNPGLGSFVWLSSTQVHDGLASIKPFLNDT